MWAKERHKKNTGKDSGLACLQLTQNGVYVRCGFVVLGVGLTDILWCFGISRMAAQPFKVASKVDSKEL